MLHVFTFVSIYASLRTSFTFTIDSPESCELSDSFQIDFRSANESTLRLTFVYAIVPMQSNLLCASSSIRIIPPLYSFGVGSEPDRRSRFAILYISAEHQSYIYALEASRLESIASVTLTTVRLSSHDEIHPRCGW